MSHNSHCVKFRSLPTLRLPPSPSKQWAHAEITEQTWTSYLLAQGDSLPHRIIGLPVKHLFPAEVHISGGKFSTNLIPEWSTNAIKTLWCHFSIDTFLTLLQCLVHSMCPVNICPTDECFFVTNMFCDPIVRQDVLKKWPLCVLSSTGCHCKHMSCLEHVLSNMVTTSNMWPSKFKLAKIG